MSESKHTPGPWMQDEDRPYDILLDDRAGENVTPLVACVFADNTDEAQWQADARLIAAAPEMYEALLHAQANMPHPDQMIDAAIAKAEGRS